MSLASLSLRRPVFAVVMSIILMLFGGIGYKFLSVRDYPAIDPPVITVRTSYTGANADIIESQITEPLEKAINGIQGVRTISSTSSQGSSTITVEFNLDVDLEAAANDVRDKVSQATRQLPQDLDAPPVVSKADASADPIIILAVQSTKFNILEINDFAANVLQEKLQTIPDVSRINIFGDKRYAMRLWFKPERMQAYNVTINDIQQALNRENIEVPGGKVFGNKTELTIKTIGKLSTEADFENVVIRSSQEGIIRLKDVAGIELGTEVEETNWKLNGNGGLALAIIPQPGSNYVKISEEFNKRLEELKKEIPEHIRFQVLFDSTKYIKQSIVEVAETLLIAFGLVVLIIYLFFRNWLIAIRPLIDIPVSLIATFFIMYLAGYSINILTMLGIVLATGLVVDDGIVVTENIFRKLEQGYPIQKAAKEGSNEILFAVISTSITLAVVFLPILFLQGFVGSLFKEFGVVVAGAVLISAFVSLTLTPVLNVWLNKKEDKPSWFYRVTEPFFEKMESGYKNTLQAFVKVKFIAFVIIGVCMGAIYWLFTTLPSELAPMEDRSNFRLSVTAPEGTSFDYMSDYVDRFASFLKDSIPEARLVFSSTAATFAGGSTNSAFLRAILTEPNERIRSQKELVDYTNKKLSQFNDGRIFVVQEQTISVGLGSRGALPVQFVIQNFDFEKIKSVIPKFLEEARKSGTFQAVDVNLKFNKPEIEITVDRLKAKDLGVTTADIAEALQAAYSGRRIGYFLMNGKQYQVIGQVSRENRDEPTDLSRVYIRNNRNELIQLSTLVSIKETSNPPQLFHYNRYKSATISASLAPGKTIGDGITTMQAIGKNLLDDTFATSLSGPSRDYAESSSNTSFAFLLALLLIYLVLAAQFESFIDPLIIMFTVPLALAGALLSLWLFGQTVNIFSQIGMIMLIGLVTKNGILIVEFANQKREHGTPKLEALLEASKQRLRPILMTSLATMLGALPIALSLGAAAQSRMPLGIVIVGGLLFSLVLTLYVIPAIYMYLSRKKQAHNEELEKV
ncbi:MAG: efflux RND transporter permease subunit [Raineya sp.]|jgi:HAE1 family hydrophobic/amphiphilic exporter-1/multidrug efflux pump|nr:efflux RND transporter permease subunit [Raineya sp.]